MFSAIWTVLPGLSRWVEYSYSTDSVLHFGDHSLLSRCGVQQGDPLGPLCFALTLQPITMRIKRELPNLLCNVWYLDDGTICGSPQDLAAALKIIEEDGPWRGLHVNRSKSLLYIPQMMTPPTIYFHSTSHFPLQASASSVSPLVQICLGK